MPDTAVTNIIPLRERFLDIRTESVYKERDKIIYRALLFQCVTPPNRHRTTRATASPARQARRGTGRGRTPRHFSLAADLLAKR